MKLHYAWIVQNDYYPQTVKLVMCEEITMHREVQVGNG